MSRTRIQPGDGDPRHGTLNGYTNLYCRCQPCRDAHTAHWLRGREDRRGRVMTTTLPHGRVSTYSNWGCRCEDCCAAQRRYDARRNRARAAS